MSEYKDIDKLKRDVRRLSALKRGSTTNITEVTESSSEVMIAGKPVKDTAVQDGDTLIYDKREKKWVAGATAANIDGGSASSVYLVSQSIDGGNANG